MNRRRLLLLSVSGLALGVAALVFAITTLSRPHRVLPAFVTEQLGAAQSSAAQPESLARDGLHATIGKHGYTASDGRSKWVSLSAAGRNAASWTHYEHGASRKTPFGVQTITTTPGSVEEFDTIFLHHGIKTW